MDVIKAQKIRETLNDLHLKINDVLPLDADQVIAGWASSGSFYYADSETRRIDGAINTLKNIREKYVDRRLEDIWKKINKRRK